MSRTKQVQWVIERHIFEEEAELALIQEVRSQGGLTVSLDPYVKDPLLIDFRDYLYTFPTIFRGSLNIGTKFQREASAYPGTIYNKKNFECISYYTYWGDYMLNNEYWLYPLAELNTDRIRGLLECCGWGSKNFFIRPNSGSKPFAGGVFNIQDLSSLYNVDRNTLVLIAPIKEVWEEYRFVVSRSQIIAGCKYLEDKQYVTKQATVDATDYLQEVLTRINPEAYPDSVYTVDVAFTSEGFSILELNSFSCSNLYSCDIKKVVTAVNNIVMQEFDAVYG